MSPLRSLTPELLDSLPPGDPSAVGSRRDLARINTLMGNARLIAGLLGPRPLGRVLEIGAGDGASTLRWARRLAPHSGQTHITLLDRQAVVAPSVRAGLRGLGWDVETVSADVLDYLQSDVGGTYDAVMANLFLHHFEGEGLRELLGLASERTALFVACEPERSALGLAGTRLLGAIGCNAVTRHDARVSVLAGFRNGELSALWPSGSAWKVEERAALPFSHTFRAERTR